jgi:hypothetical protein
MIFDLYLFVDFASLAAFAMFGAVFVGVLCVSLVFSLVWGGACHGREDIYDI